MGAVLMDSWVATEWPCAEVHETSSTYEVEIETPGFGAEELVVEVEGHTLTVLGKPERGHEGSAFDFTFTLPATAALDRLCARFAHGVLTVTAPLHPISGRRTLKIESPHLIDDSATGA